MRFSKAKPTMEALQRGFTLVELMVASGLGMIALAVVAALCYFAVHSFLLIGNYSEMGRENRYALDIMLREIRKSTLVIGYSTNNPKSLTLTNSVDGKIVKISWDSASTNSAMIFEMTGKSAETVLEGCESWDFGFYQRTPIVSTTNIAFYSATNGSGQIDLSLCKLIDMSWKCSRTILKKKINSENLQSAQIMLRNKQ